MKIWVLALVFLTSCSHLKNEKQESKAVEPYSQVKEQVSFEKLEKEKLQLELQNSILIEALKDRRKSTIEIPKGKIVKQFPQFEEMIFDQAETAYRDQDKGRLLEAIRILKANQPHSSSIETMYYWLAQLQKDSGEFAQALVTYNEIIKNYPESVHISKALFQKAKLYEQIQLKAQAFKIYSDIRNLYPMSEEGKKAEAKLQSFKKKKLQREKL